MFWLHKNKNYLNIFQKKQKHKKIVIPSKKKALIIILKKIVLFRKYLNRKKITEKFKLKKTLEIF